MVLQALGPGGFLFNIDMSTTEGIRGTSTSTATASSRWNRINAIRWLRKMHGWIGLWGATLGLLFGTSGILLNHRAVMKIPAVQAQESTVQLPLPQPAPENAKAMLDWLQGELKFDHPNLRSREEPAPKLSPARMNWRPWLRSSSMNEGGTRR